MRKVIEAGPRSPLASEPEMVPANFVYDRGDWYHIKKDTEAVLVKNEAGALIVRPA